MFVVVVSSFKIKRALQVLTLISSAPLAGLELFATKQVKMTYKSDQAVGY